MVGGPELRDGVQDGGDVVGFRRRREGARRGAELEVDDAVGGEVAEDGEGGVPEGGEVVDEVVDVGGEEGEEAGEGGVSREVRTLRETDNCVLCHYCRLRGYLRLEVIIMFSVGHLYKRISQVRLTGLLLHEPDFVKTLPADAPAQVSMKLSDEKRPWLVNFF